MGVRRALQADHQLTAVLDMARQGHCNSYDVESNSSCSSCYCCCMCSCDALPGLCWLPGCSQPAAAAHHPGMYACVSVCQHLLAGWCALVTGATRG